MTGIEMLRLTESGVLVNREVVNPEMLHWFVIFLSQKHNKIPLPWQIPKFSVINKTTPNGEDDKAEGGAPAHVI